MNECKCGHAKEAHIYHEGACRTGKVVCECETYVAKESKQRPDLETMLKHCDGVYDKPLYDVLLYASQVEKERDEVRELLKEMDEQRENIAENCIQCGGVSTHADDCKLDKLIKGEG